MLLEAEALPDLGHGGPISFRHPLFTGSAQKPLKNLEGKMLHAVLSVEASSIEVNKAKGVVLPASASLGG
jgi:hypothetical protein